MQARELMTEDPICCMPTDSIRAVARQMREYGCGLLPVVNNMDEKTLLGVITDRDIVCRILANEGTDCNNATVQNAMTTEQVWSAMVNSSVDDVIELMEEGQVRRIPVIDDSKRVVGIISVADIALELDEPDDVAEVIEEISEPTHIPHA